MAISFEEIKDDVLETTVSKMGIPTGAGKAGNAKLSNMIVAQYPAERASANDTKVDIRVNDLYKNGLLFTAYEFNSRTTPSLRDFRKRHSTPQLIDLNPRNYIARYSGTSKLDQNSIANILLPRSKTDVDNISHKFNDVGESLMSKGGGSVTGALSNIASTAVFGAINSLSNGIMADYGEQIHTTSRSMYAGADHRSKVFTWELTPKNIEDLIQILIIYRTLANLSYGRIGTSGFAKEVKSAIDNWYKQTFINPLTPDDSDRSGTFMEDVTSFLTNVIVVSNPVVWMIKNFGDSNSFDGVEDVFGPAQIQSIRFDKSPNGNFSGLAIAPNLPNTFILEVTFREIMTLQNGDLFVEMK